MAGERDLKKLLESLSPCLLDGDFVFCTVQDANYHNVAGWVPLASFQEEHGLSLVVSKEHADKAGFDYDAVFKCITLNVHSSLEAIGLTAAVSGKLAERGISANVIAAYHHDHLFVQAGKEEAALLALREFSR